MATIRRSYLDGTLVVQTWKAGNSRNDAYSYPSDQEILNCIDYASSWADIDESVYRAFCDNLGLQYDSYDDPDVMFEDLQRAVIAKEEEAYPSEMLVRKLKRRQEYHLGDVYAFKAFYKCDLMQALKEAGYAETEENMQAVLEQTGLATELSTTQMSEQDTIFCAINRTNGLILLKEKRTKDRV